MELKERAQVISAIANAISLERLDLAKEILHTRYPFVAAQRPIVFVCRPPEVRATRIANNKKKNPKTGFHQSDYTPIFIRDGFVDRYTGDYLIFPPVLRVLSIILPNDFPYHDNWKYGHCHVAYWELSATVDHVKPLSLGNLHQADNWITTSMRQNREKDNISLESLGWKLYSPGNIKEWDGLLTWFLQYTKQHPEILIDKPLHQWYSAALENESKFKS